MQSKENNEDVSLADFRKIIENWSRYMKSISVEESLKEENFKQYIPSLYIDSNSTVLYVHDVAQQRNVFVSENFTKITGHAVDKFINDTQFLYSIIVPSELERVLSIAKWSLNYLLNSNECDRKGAKLRVIYRIVAADGRILCLQDEVFFAEWDDNGRLAMVAGFLTDISHLKKHYKVEGVLEAGGKIIPIPLISEKKLFSLRETEILKLAYSGLSSKQIAEKLQISTNTINNHRANMLRQHEAKNFIEVLKIAKEWGFL